MHCFHFLALFDRGSIIHKKIHQHFTGGQDGQSANDAFWDSVNTEIWKFHSVHACEQKLTHSVLGYRGVIDCIACHDRQVCTLCPYNSFCMRISFWKYAESLCTVLKVYFITVNQPYISRELNTKITFDSSHVQYIVLLCKNS